jgi:glucose-induced degradation protein 8
MARGDVSCTGRASSSLLPSPANAAAAASAAATLPPHPTPPPHHLETTKQPPTNKRHISPEQWDQRLAAVRVDRQALNRLVANWLVAEGHASAAAAFREESGTDPAADLAAVEDRVRVRRAVRRGDVEAAVERVNDLDPTLLARRPPLLFRLQCQRLVEMVRRGDAEGALAFAEEYLAPAGEEHPELLEELGE